MPETFRFLMRGGDSEFINYLKYILQRKCVHFVFKKLKNMNVILNSYETISNSSA